MSAPCWHSLGGFLWVFQIKLRYVRAHTFASRSFTAWWPVPSLGSFLCWCFPLSFPREQHKVPRVPRERACCHCAVWLQFSLCVRRFMFLQTWVQATNAQGQLAGPQGSVNALHIIQDKLLAACQVCLRSL